MQISLFNGFADKNPKPITIREVVEIIRADQRLQVLTENHRRYRAAGDTVRADAEKQHMPCYSVAVLFSGGKQQKHIVAYTGLSIVDLDHIPGERMAEVLTMVRNDPHTLLAYTTISGEGLRILFRYGTPSNNSQARLLNEPKGSAVATDALASAMGRTQPSLQNNSCEHPGGAPHRGGRREGTSVATVARYESATCDEESFSSPEECALAPLDLSLQRSLACEHQRTEGVCWGGSLYKHAFLTGNEYYCNLLNLPYDEKCKNATRISGMAHDPEVYYNPDATAIVVDLTKKSAGRPRKGTKIERVEESVIRELELRGVVYAPGSHNKYISDACYMMNRYGVSLGDCTEWALDRFNDYQQQGNDVASIVRSCYQQTEEHGTARPPRAEKESRYATIKDIQDWLRSNDIRIRHNLITRKREISFNDNVDVNADAKRASVATVARYESATCDEESFSSPEECALAPLDLSPQRSSACSSCHPDGWSTSALSSTFSFWKELEDKSVNSLYCRFCLDTGRQAKISDFYIIIESDFYPEYHPLKEYLESLPAWNGIDYIDQVASMVHVTGCTQEMHNRFFKQWLVAMVAAWLEPDKTNHEILTYIGPQGIYKSTFVRHLLPTEPSGYFSTKNFAGRMTKDDRLELTEMALISLEELDSLQSAELNQLKAITTDPTVNERAAFARYKERRAHIASFCGTGNNPRFLTDLTDNRRWLPFLVRDIDSPWTHPMPYAGMYSQAYTLYRAGFRYWFDADDNAELQRHNRQFEEPCMEEELIATYLRVPYGDEVGEFLTATRIIELIGGAVKRPLSAKKVALCMNRLGFEQRRTKYSRGWNVIILTGNDIKEDQRLNAHRSAAE